MKITIEISDEVIEEEIGEPTDRQAVREIVYDTIVGDPVSRIQQKKLGVLSMLREADAEDYDIQSSESLYSKQINIARSAQVSFD